jgi:hypothetical protein
MWTPESAQLSDRTLEPNLAVGSPAPSESTPVSQPQLSTAHSSTPVKEMVGSERAAWIDYVWGSAAGVMR